MLDNLCQVSRIMTLPLISGITAKLCESSLPGRYSGKLWRAVVLDGDVQWAERDRLLEVRAPPYVVLPSDACSRSVRRWKADHADDHKPPVCLSFSEWSRCSGCLRTFIINGNIFYFWGLRLLSFLQRCNSTGTINAMCKIETPFKYNCIQMHIKEIGLRRAQKFCWPPKCHMVPGAPISHSDFIIHRRCELVCTVLWFRRILYNSFNIVE
jgi:hypothetical protein